MNPLTSRLLGPTASAVDRALVAAMQIRNRGVRRGPESLSHEQRIARLAEIRAEYGGGQLIEDPDAFFAAPPKLCTLDVRERRVAKPWWRGECFDLSWASAFEPFSSSMRDEYQAHLPNRRAHARLYLGPVKGRPAVILVHGYMAGRLGLEERLWPIPWMSENGLDAALIVLPFHGVRTRADGGGPLFPGADPRFTNEGFRQLVADFRVLSALLKERGAPAVGVMGMSLGGYSSALLATLEPNLAFAVPIIPLASIADFARDQGRLGTGESAAAQHTALEQANWIVSPFARPRRIPRERVLVIGAEADRVTPLDRHAQKLAAHFDVPLLRLRGGHLLQTWRTEAFRAVGRMLHESGHAGRIGGPA